MALGSELFGRDATVVLGGEDLLAEYAESLASYATASGSPLS